MDDNFWTVFCFWHFALISGPFLGYDLNLTIRSAAPRLARRFYILLALQLLLVLICLASPLSLRGVLADQLFAAFGYIVYCILAFALLSLRRFGKPVFAIAAIPMALGVILATVGALGLGMALSETQLLSDTPINSRYSCRIQSFGGATSKEGGREVNVLRYSPFLPGLELEKFSRSFDDMDYKVDQLKCNLDPASPNTILIDVPSYTGSPEQIRVVMD